MYFENSKVFKNALQVDLANKIKENTKNLLLALHKKNICIEDTIKNIYSELQLAQSEKNYSEIQCILNRLHCYPLDTIKLYSNLISAHYTNVCNIIDDMCDGIENRTEAVKLFVDNLENYNLILTKIKKISEDIQNKPVEFSSYSSNYSVYQDIYAQVDNILDSSETLFSEIIYTLKNEDEYEQYDDDDQPLLEEEFESSFMNALESDDFIALTSNLLYEKFIQTTVTNCAWISRLAEHTANEIDHCTNQHIKYVVHLHKHEPYGLHA